jgi:hypothetical protein
VVTVRRTLTPFPGVPEPGSGKHAMRRGEARKETSERIVFRTHGKLLDGWALNVSRGGLRAILEAKVELGDLFEVRRGDDGWRPGRVVWIQDEPDGVVVGVAYLDTPPPAADGPAKTIEKPVAAGIAGIVQDAQESGAARTRDDAAGPEAPSELPPVTKKSAQ